MSESINFKISSNQSKEVKLIAAAYELCLHQLNSQLEDKKIGVTVATLTTIIRIAMEIVESTVLKGEAQNILVTKIIRKVIVDAPISDNNEKLLLDMVDQNIVRDVITLVVSATQGKLNINTVQDVAVGCCLAFLQNKQNKQNKQK